MLYRILTEDGKTFRNNALDIVSSNFQGFTVLSGQGYWNGKAENSLIIEISSSDEIYNKVVKVAKQIKRVNHQEGVLIQRIIANDILIGG